MSKKYRKRRKERENCIIGEKVAPIISNGFIITKEQNNRFIGKSNKEVITELNTIEK